MRRIVWRVLNNYFPEMGVLLYCRSPLLEGNTLRLLFSRLFLDSLFKRINVERVLLEGIYSWGNEVWPFPSVLPGQFTLSLGEKFIIQEVATPCTRRRPEISSHYPICWWEFNSNIKLNQPSNQSLVVDYIWYIIVRGSSWRDHGQATVLVGGFGIDFHIWVGGPLCGLQ